MDTMNDEVRYRFVARIRYLAFCGLDTSALLQIRHLVLLRVTHLALLRTRHLT